MTAKKKAAAEKPAAKTVTLTQQQAEQIKQMLGPILRPQNGDYTGDPLQMANVAIQNAQRAGQAIAQVLGEAEKASA